MLAAAAEGTPAYEGYEGHGLFTWAVLDALKNGDRNGNGSLSRTYRIRSRALPSSSTAVAEPPLLRAAQSMIGNLRGLARVARISQSVGDYGRRHTVACS